MEKKEIVTRPRSFSCVLLDSRPTCDEDDEDDDDEDDEDEDELKNELISDKSQELFDDDEVKMVLEKKSEERTLQEREILFEFMKHMTAFNNTSQSVKEALCSVMRFVCYKKCDWLVVEDGEEPKDWFLIINGSVKVVKADGSIEILSVGRSFGVCRNRDVTQQNGQIKTNQLDTQFVCVSKDDFLNIFDEFEQKKINVEDDGRLVLVLERKVDEDNKDGYIVIQGSKEKLMTQLLDSNMVDPTYIEDFLLTYRVFVDSPLEVTDCLMKMFTDKSRREKVARVLLLWINNHFEDFQENHQLLDFVDSFKKLLKLHKMFGHLKMLDVAHSTHSHPRLLTLSRPNKDDNLPFSLIGGLERGIKGIFISRVDKTSRLHVEGLRRGDQLLETNNKNCERATMKETMKVIKSSTHLSIKVKSNFYGFEEACRSRRGSNPKKYCTLDASTTKWKLNISQEAGDDDDISIFSSDPDDDKSSAKKTITKFCRTLFGFNISGQRQDSSDESSSSLKSDLINKFYRKHSFPIKLLNKTSSDPDLSNLTSRHSTSLNNVLMPTLTTSGDNGAFRTPDAVLKVYRVDHTFKFVPINKETTCREVVLISLKEFNCNEHPGSFSLCEVTFGRNNLTRMRTLADHVLDLSDRLPLNARYYLKNNNTSSVSVPEEIFASVTREASFSFLELPPHEVATRLTLRAFRMLRDLRSSDHICELFNKHTSKSSKERVDKFSQLSNEELFWVATEVCLESNLMKRVKIVKQFIKIAELCRTAQSYNSMFSILSGLRHGSVARLRNTWDKLPPKYLRIFDDLQETMDPSRNMAKYRNILANKVPDIPAIPFFPIFRKDTTFIHLGNDTKVNELINFEKMRMLAKEVRNLNRITKGSYMTSTDVFKPFKDQICNGTEGWRKRGLQFLPRRLYEEGVTGKKAQAYLESVRIIYDEVELEEMSQSHETSMKFLTLKMSNNQSSSTSNILSTSQHKEMASKGVGKKLTSQPFIDKIMTSTKSKVKSNLKKGDSSVSSVSSSSSSSKKCYSGKLVFNFIHGNLYDSEVGQSNVAGEKSSVDASYQRWSSCSNDQSHGVLETYNSTNQSSGEFVNIPPPVIVPITLHPPGHLTVRPISHSPSKKQLANKFPNFKPHPNSHQPYLNLCDDFKSSSPFRHKQLFFETICSPTSNDNNNNNNNNGGDDDDPDSIATKTTQVTSKVHHLRNIRSLSSDHLLSDSKDYHGL